MDGQAAATEAAAAAINSGGRCRSKKRKEVSYSAQPTQNAQAAGPASCASPPNPNPATATRAPGHRSSFCTSKANHSKANAINSGVSGVSAFAAKAKESQTTDSELTSEGSWAAAAADAERRPSAS